MSILLKIKNQFFFGLRLWNRLRDRVRGQRFEACAMCLYRPICLNKFHNQLDSTDTQHNTTKFQIHGLPLFNFVHTHVFEPFMWFFDFHELVGLLITIYEVEVLQKENEWAGVMFVDDIDFTKCVKPDIFLVFAYKFKNRQCHKLNRSNTDLRQKRS